jgi:hypothetical protein
MRAAILESEHASSGREVGLDFVDREHDAVLVPELAQGQHPARSRLQMVRCLRWKSYPAVMTRRQWVVMMLLARASASSALISLSLRASGSVIKHGWVLSVDD